MVLILSPSLLLSLRLSLNRRLQGLNKTLLGIKLWNPAWLLKPLYPLKPVRHHAP